MAQAEAPLGQKGPYSSTIDWLILCATFGLTEEGTDMRLTFSAIALSAIGLSQMAWARSGGRRFGQERRPPLDDLAVGYWIGSSLTVQLAIG
jgi:hypothetical protein